MIEATAGLSFTSNNAPDIGVNPINGLLTVVRATEIERLKGEEKEEGRRGGGGGERDERANTRAREEEDARGAERGGREREWYIMKNR